MRGDPPGSTGRSGRGPARRSAGCPGAAPARPRMARSARVTPSSGHPPQDHRRVRRRDSRWRSLYRAVPWATASRPDGLPIRSLDTARTRAFPRAAGLRTRVGRAETWASSAGPRAAGRRRDRFRAGARVRI